MKVQIQAVPVVVGVHRCRWCSTLKLSVREQLCIGGGVELVSDRSCTAADRVGRYCEPTEFVHVTTADRTMRRRVIR